MISRHEKEYIKNEYLAGVDFQDVKLSHSQQPSKREVDRQYMENSYPEQDFKYIQHRTRIVYDRLQKEKNFEHKTAYLCFSHRSSCDIFLWEICGSYP